HGDRLQVGLPVALEGAERNVGLERPGHVLTARIGGGAPPARTLTAGATPRAESPATGARTCGLPSRLAAERTRRGGIGCSRSWRRRGVRRRWRFYPARNGYESNTMGRVTALHLGPA